MTSTERTQAESAIELLDAKYVKLPRRDYGFAEYDQIHVCHGCGRFHAVRGCFHGSSLSFAFEFSDGKSKLCIPARGCDECMRKDGVIRDAYEKGMTRAAYDRAADEIGAKRRPLPVSCSICGALSNPAHLNAAGAHNLCAALERIGKPTPPLDTDPRWAR